MFRVKPIKMLLFAVALLLSLTAILSGPASLSTVSAQAAPTITVGSGTGYVNSTKVALTVYAVNATQMRFSNDYSVWSNWEPYAISTNWTLTDGDGAKTVYAQFQDSSNQLTSANAQVNLDTVPPVPYPYYEWASVENRTLSFDGSGSIDDSPIRFLWSFGDGNTSTGVTVTHTYAAIANYSAYLTVTDIAGNSATQPFIVYVLPASAFATDTPTPGPQNPTATPAITPPVSTSTQPTPGPGVYLSETTLLVLVIIVLLVVVVLLVFLLRKRPKTINKS